MALSKKQMYMIAVAAAVLALGGGVLYYLWSQGDLKWKQVQVQSSHSVQLPRMSCSSSAGAPKSNLSMAMSQPVFQPKQPSCQQQGPAYHGSPSVVPPISPWVADSLGQSPVGQPSAPGSSSLEKVFGGFQHLTNPHHPLGIDMVKDNEQPSDALKAMMFSKF